MFRRSAAELQGYSKAVFIVTSDRLPSSVKEAKRIIRETGFDPVTSGLSAPRASTAPPP